jgi:ABC-type transport system substrate-binding protein
LTVFDENLSGRPELAESWDVSSDGLIWTFHIRPGATYSTGRDYTADDVIFSYDNTLNPNTNSIHIKGLEGVNRPTRIDAKTVRITTEVPRASMLTKIVEGTSGRVLTAVDREKIAADGQAGFNRTPVGASWFMVRDHVFGERLELEKNPFYWDVENRPFVDSVTMFNIGEGATIVAALKSKQVDFVESYPVQFFRDLTNTADIIVDDTPDIGFQMIYFNRRADRQAKIGKANLPSDDVRVRRAIGNALDRQNLIDKAFQGRAIPAYGPINPAMKEFFVDLSQTSLQRFNLPEAKRLMAEAAAENGERLGFTADGFKIKLMATIVNRVPAEVVQDALRRNLGIEIELELGESSVTQVRSPNGEWEWQMGGSGGDPDPDDAVDDWFADGAKFNHEGYNNQRVNELNFLQKTATDIEQRKKFLIEMQEILSNDAPGVFTYHFVQSNAYRDYVKGYVHTPALADLDTVWLDR